MVEGETSITDRIRGMVMQGDLRPGDRLDAAAPVQALNAEPAALAEAVAALSQEGLLVQDDLGAHVVRAFSPREITEAYVVRGNLEALAARLAAERGLDALTGKLLRDCLDEGDAILASGRLTEDGAAPWRAMNDRLHAAILRASGNKFLMDVMLRTFSVPLASSCTIHWYEFARIKHSHHHHHAIVDAIERRQGPRAESLMQEHIYQASEIIRDQFASLREPPEAPKRPKLVSG